MKNQGPMARRKTVRCPECGQQAEAISNQYGKTYRVPKHCVGNIGGTLNIMCPGGPV